MPVRYDKLLSDERGQITVFLSLLFLVFMGFSFCIIQGVQNYSASALGEDAVKCAGENVLANYDRELFNRYHLFFLDPREWNYILSDGKTTINQYCSEPSFLRLHCNSLEITEEKTALDEDGLYLKHEIREYMKYREEQKAEETLEKLAQSVKKNDIDRKQCQKEVDRAEKQVEDNSSETGRESQADQDKEGQSKEKAGDETTQTDNTDTMDNTESDENEASPEVQQQRASWKEIKETLQLLVRTGILFYVADQPEQISKRSISGENLPSKERGSTDSKKQQKEADRAEHLSFSGLRGIKSLFSVDFSGDISGTLWTKEKYIVPYIEECFLSYGDKESKNNMETTLFYETEYLINGKASDLENLKSTANGILLLRFINNYIFTGKDADMKAQIATMAAALAGVLGMPQTTKGIEVVIRTAISYGETLLELHTLFNGGEIPLTKSKENWNLELKTMVKQLKEKQKVKKGKQNVSYKDYLKLLLYAKGNTKVLCYRMMDIMQENVAGKEPGFLMKNSLFSYRWKGEIYFGTVKLKFVRQHSY